MQMDEGPGRKHEDSFWALPATAKSSREPATVAEDSLSSPSCHIPGTLQGLVFFRVWECLYLLIMLKTALQRAGHP